MSATVEPDLSDGTARDLSELSNANEVVAGEAFARLWHVAHPYALRQLARRGIRGEEAEDVCQSAATSLWAERRGVRARDLGGWIALVFRRVT